MKLLPILLLVATPQGLVSQLEMRDLTTDERVNWRGEARDVDAIDRVVIHSSAALRSSDGKTSIPPEQWLDFDEVLKLASAFKRGAHYLIGRDGTIARLVPDEYRAPHATVYNERSIGVELIGLNDEPFVRSTGASKLSEEVLEQRRKFTDAQYTALDSLLKLLAGKYEGLRAIRHSDIHDRAATNSATELLKRPAGEQTAELTADTDLRILDARDHEDSRWYKVRTTNPNRETVRGWVRADAIRRTHRKFDPGSAFDATKIKAVPFVDATDY